jgi:hypothetical protein
MNISFTTKAFAEQNTDPSHWESTGETVVYVRELERFKVIKEKCSFDSAGPYLGLCVERSENIKPDDTSREFANELLATLRDKLTGNDLKALLIATAFELSEWQHSKEGRPSLCGAILEDLSEIKGFEQVTYSIE